MKSLTVGDALCQNHKVIQVHVDERPSSNRLVGTIYAVFDSAEGSGDADKFLGLVTEREISIFPQRIFADLLAPHAPPPLTPDLPLEGVYGDAGEIAYGEDTPLPVVDCDGAFLGVITRNSVLTALFRQQHQLLGEAEKLNELLEEDRAQLAAWSSRLTELHQASRTLLGLLTHTTLHIDLLQAGIEALAKLLQARYGAIGLLDGKGDLKQFVYTGISAEAAARIDHFPEGRGLLGIVVRENQALRLDDLSRDPRSTGFPAHHPPMKTLLAVPISHLHHVYGRIYLCDKFDDTPFSPEDEVLALSFAHSLSLVLDNAREMEEIRQAQHRLDFVAHYDSLTGLPNRTLFLDRLQQAIAQATRNDKCIGLLFLDIDNFKFINDTLGHAHGDELLKGAAQRVRECIRGNDTVARLGGDEFTIMLVELDDGQHAAAVAKKVLDAVAKPFLLDEHESYVTASIGIAVYPGDGNSIQLLLKHADTAMYHAKAQGKNNYQFYAPGMNEKAQQRLTVEQHLRRALENGEFTLYYQPQVDLANGGIVGVEGLLRWTCYQLGPVPPSEFIPIAEETGLIAPIGEWVIETACRQARQWHVQGHDRLRMAINLSSLQFRQKNLARDIWRILEESGLRAEFLELEITESALMQSTDNTIAMLKQLKEIGVHFSIDDFGTGYSSLSYLKRFPISSLKIDQSFVRDIASDADDAAIVIAIIAMAESLKLNTVAEGVETVAQLDFLREHGCRTAQGYYFGRPSPAADISRLLDGGPPEPQSSVSPR
jgi:diguanylate cyclase (GGDEF)-like protein